MNILTYFIEDTFKNSEDNKTLGIFCKFYCYEDLINYISSYVPDVQFIRNKNYTCFTNRNNQIKIYALTEGQIFRGCRFTTILCDRAFSERYIKEVLVPMSPKSHFSLHLDLILSKSTYY